MKITITKLDLFRVQLFLRLQRKYLLVLGFITSLFMYYTLPSFAADEEFFIWLIGNFLVLLLSVISGFLLVVSIFFFCLVTDLLVVLTRVKFPRELDVSFSERGMVTRLEEEGEGIHFWQNIHRLERTKHFIVAQLKGVTGSIVFPRHCFSTQEAYDSCWDEVSQFYSNSKHNE